LQLPRTIFSVQDELPSWPSDSDDSMCLESISDPDDMGLNDEVENDDDAAVGVIDDNEAEEEEEGEVVELDVEGAVGEEEAGSEKFFDTYSGSASTSSASAGSTRHQHRRLRSDDVDTEDDPVDPVTPGPNSRFDIVAPPSRKDGQAEAKDTEEYRGFEDDEEDGSGDDIEDDWVDPSLPSPASTSRPRPLPKPLQQQPLPPPVPRKDHVSSSISSASSSSPAAPPMSKSKSSSSKKGSLTVKGKKSKKQIPVPVPQVKLVNQQQPKEHYPFPVTPVDDPSGWSPHRAASQDRGSGASSGHNHSGVSTEKRMHTARARDGGRTQSGGVKGILPDD
jgi:cysteine protease ATG4